MSASARGRSPSPSSSRRASSTFRRRTCAACRRISRCPTSARPTTPSPTARCARPERAAAARPLHRRARRLFARRACTTTPARRRSISRISCCSPTTSATSTSSSASAARWWARTAMTASWRPATSCSPPRRAPRGGPEPGSPRYLPQMPAYHLKRPDWARHHAGQYRRRPEQRQDDHRPPRGAPARLLAHARPLRRPSAQPAARRLRARPRLCARRPRARPGPAELGAGAADRRGAGGAAGGDRDGHRPARPGPEDAAADRHRRHHRQPQLGAPLRRAVQPPEPRPRHRRRHGIRRPSRPTACASACPTARCSASPTSRCTAS